MEVFLSVDIVYPMRNTVTKYKPITAVIDIVSSDAPTCEKFVSNETILGNEI